MPNYSGSPAVTPAPIGASTATWKTISVSMLRAMLNDVGASSYSNSRLEDLLITAAYYLPIEINFATSYIVDIDQQTILLDPLTTSDGHDFIALMVLKAACMVDESSFRTAALLQGVTARCGPAILQTGSYGQYLKELLKEGPCKSYQTLKHEYNFGYGGAKILRAVMSPFVSNSFNTFNQRSGEYS